METRELMAFIVTVLALSFLFNNMVSCTDHVNEMNHYEYLARLVKDEKKP